MKGTTAASNLRSVYERFPAALLRVRLRRELTQTDVADLFDVGVAEVSRWERGQRVPRVETLVEILEWIGEDGF